jgi:lysophospholipase L1-like esterase
MCALAAALPQQTKLVEALGAKAVAVERPCREQACAHRPMAGFYQKLDRLERTREGKIRVLQLGDSHIAGDYITGTIRERLQARFGNAGRGFTAIDQRLAYGGRRLERRGWTRTRIVDGDGPGHPFGFSGMALTATRANAAIAFALDASDKDLVLYYHAQPRGGGVVVETEHRALGRISSDNPSEKSLTARIPLRAPRAKAATRVQLRAEAPGTTIFGVSFESKQRGIIYDAVGPVGADARTYSQLEQASFAAHLTALGPDLVVLMVGGNDARLVRLGQRTLDEVKRDTQLLVERIQHVLPNADCLLWGPLDAGERADGRIVTRAFVTEVRDLQRRVAAEYGCAFWDAFEAMGGNGAFGRWLAMKLMNKDLVHPRAAGGALLGELFVDALLGSFRDSSVAELGRR